LLSVAIAVADVIVVVVDGTPRIDIKFHGLSQWAHSRVRVDDRFSVCSGVDFVVVVVSFSFR